MLSALEQQLQLDYFRTQGFERRKCTSCGSWFWTLDPKRTLCGDAPCVEYAFIGAPLTPKRYTLAEMRETFLRFFEERKHTRVPRYPVVARWREDIYLTIASIADFQPWVTSGQAPPPANPLVISQPCIRLNDLDNVGKSGRHFTTFEMMAFHSFNRPGEEHYWADEAVEFADTFLTQRLGFAREGITYKENPWAGGGNAGPAVEVLAGGLEVATLVFMNLKLDPQGTVEVKGEMYSPLDLKIVDTGWGLERLTWASQGTPTAYDAVFPDLVRFVREHSRSSVDSTDAHVARIVAEHARVAGVLNLDASSKLAELRREVARRLATHGIHTSAEELKRVMTPVENAYALSDHAKCLSFMLGDGIVPSNAKAGYLARLIIRRSLRLMESLGFQLRLRDLVAKELELLAPEFPDLRQEEATILEMLDLETERYRETIEKGSRLIRTRIKKGSVIDVEQLIELYDTHGVPPQVVRQVAEPLGVQVEIPDAFDALVAERHSREKPAAQAPNLPRLDLPATRPLYYEQPEATEFDASVLWANDELVVLDQTLLYPEGGGQPCDHGTLTAGSKTVRVTDVQKHNGIVFHRVTERLPVGELVHGHIDVERRLGHMRHHTATHIVNGAARAVLGNHVWQTGAAKSVDSARIDLTHFKRITREELHKIEALANHVVMQNIPLERAWLERDKAEKKFGVRIYQGGVAPGSKIRVIRIGHHDVEACGGTHAPHTSDVGPIKIYKAERIQDGVERLEYSAGPKAIERTQHEVALLEQAAHTLSVPAENLPKTVERFFEEWKERGKQVEVLRAELAELRFQQLMGQAERVGSLRLLTFQGPPQELAPLAERVAASADAVGVFAGAEGATARIVVARGKTATAVHAGEVAKAACAVLGGNGGGRSEMGQGAGPRIADLDRAVEVALDEVRRRLR